jgi:c-di-GMP-binding flagellar brake protein YcgR
MTGGKVTVMERRQYNRINALLDAEEQVLIESGTQLVRSTLINLSAGGALLALKEPEAAVAFQTGGAFHVFLDNGGHVLELNTKAVRTDGQKIAFQFSDLTAEQKRAIHTKLIRMAIISARVRGGAKNGENEYSSEPEACQTQNGILAGNDM